MMFSAPSFLAAATRASMPPRSAADFALPAATAPPDEAAPDPLLVVVPVLLGGAHAETASAAPTTRPVKRARRVVVTSCLLWIDAADRHPTDRWTSEVSAPRHRLASNRQCPSGGPKARKYRRSVAGSAVGWPLGRIWPNFSG